MSEKALVSSDPRESVQLKNNNTKYVQKSILTHFSEGGLFTVLIFFQQKCPSA